MIGLLPYDSARLLLILMRVFTRFLAKVELGKRASIENMKICKFRETSKVSSLVPHLMNMSEVTEGQL